MLFDLVFPPRLHGEGLLDRLDRLVRADRAGPDHPDVRAGLEAAALDPERALLRADVLRPPWG